MRGSFFYYEKSMKYEDEPPIPIDRRSVHEYCGTIRRMKPPRLKAFE
jgi:hypothetical protein